MSDAYRHRARAVRQETRAHLAALRAARRGERGERRAGGAAAQTADTPVDDGIFVPPTAVGPTAATPEHYDAASYDTPQSAPETEAAPPDPLTADHAAEPTSDAAPPQTDGLALAETLAETKGPDIPAADPASAAHDSAPDLTATEADVANDPAAAPDAGAVATDALERLPGIGPGLIWFFEQRGLTDLTALAAADADQLRADIGFIGSLIDFDGWIAFARAHARS